MIQVAGSMNLLPSDKVHTISLYSTFFVVDHYYVLIVVANNPVNMATVSTPKKCCV
ncbi:MAG: hypothetical protein ACI4DK_07725 [Lachnospiraceae bacterium]